MSPGRLRIKLLAIAVPAVLIATLAACAGSEAPPSPTATATAAATPAAPQPTATAAAPASTSAVPLTGPGIDLATDRPTVTMFGVDAGDFPEGISSLGQGDFNGDGIPDSLIGAPLADGPDNSRDRAGEAYVIFGSATPPASIDLAEEEQDITIFGGAVGDGLGFSVLGADVNGDGTDDILVGAPGASGKEDPRTDQGQVYVFFGSPDLSGVLDIAEKPQSLTITGAEGFSRVGHTIASGDVNGDGINDIVLGAPFAGRKPGTPPGSARTAEGEAYVIAGGPGLSGEVRIPDDQQDFTMRGKQPFSQFGATVAAGDVNGDGIDDIIVGAPQSDGPGGDPEAPGAAYIFAGAKGLSGRVTIGEGAADVVVLGAGERHNLGSPLAVGDFNGDGIDDAAVGARLAAGPGAGEGRKASGAVYFIFGRSDLAGTLEMAKGDEDGAVFGPQRSQVLPSSLASGDLNGDGITDLILGSGPAGAPGGRAAAGVVYVVFGEPGLSIVDLATGSQDLAITGADAGDALGSSVALIEAGGGEGPELLLLASRADGPDDARPDAGEVYIVEIAPLSD